MNPINSIFMLLMFILGITLIATSLKISKMADCKSKKLDNSNRGILIIGVMLTMASISYSACSIKCDCSKTENVNTNIYMSFMLILGIILITLGSIVHKESVNEGCDSVKTQAPTVWGIGTTIVLICSGLIGYKAMSNKQLGGKYTRIAPARDLQTNGLSPKIYDYVHKNINFDDIDRQFARDYNIEDIY